MSLFNFSFMAARFAFEDALLRFEPEDALLRLEPDVDLGAEVMVGVMAGVMVGFMVGFMAVIILFLMLAWPTFNLSSLPSISEWSVDNCLTA